MIYTTCLMAYASFSYTRPLGVRVVLGLSLAFLSVFITLYYHYLQDPIFHQNAYAILTTVVVIRSMYTMEVTLRPKWRKSREEDRILRQQKGLPVPTKERQHYENVRDMKTLKTMWFMVAYGLSMFLGGFAIWNLDNYFCPVIRRWRKEIGLPWGIILEGHGWWYVSVFLLLLQPNTWNYIYTHGGVPLTQLQAYHDGHRCIHVHHLGNLATTLPERTPGRLPPALGAFLALPRDYSYHDTLREWRLSRQKVHLEFILDCRTYFGPHCPALLYSLPFFGACSKYSQNDCAMSLDQK